MLLGLTFSLVFVSALAQESNDFLIFPYPRNGDEYTVSTEDNIIIGFGWAGCRYGAVQSFLTASQVSWTLTKGDVQVASGADDNQYWGPIVETPVGTGATACIGKIPEHIWSTAWRYPLGQLEAGVYTFHAHWWLDHPVGDVADYDGDGVPDFLIGTVVDHTITIYVDGS